MSGEHTADGLGSLAVQPIRFPDKGKGKGKGKGQIR